MNGVYETSTNKPEEIFALNGKETRELYKAIQEGKKEVSFGTFRISIDTPINIDEIDKTFNNYNTKLDSIDEQKSKRIVDEILKYTPTIPNEKFVLVLKKLTTEGSYYELLLDENCPSKLRTTLLETFWNNFDSDNGTNYASKVIENYKAEQKRIKEEEMQRRKLESIKTIDWTL